MSHQIFYNVNLLSSHPGFIHGSADALSVNGNTIEAVGSREEILALAGSHTQLTDLGGRTLLPGLHDTHIHLWKVGNLKTFMLDVRPASSLDHMLTLLQEYNRQYPDADWVTARGFNEVGWKDGRMPTKDDLDKIIEDKPVYVIRTCAHIAVCNSKALEIAGITVDTVAPEGGVIYKDDAGRPNGLFSETALGLVSSHIPPYNKEQLKIMVRAAREELYRYGVTAVTDPAVDQLLLEAYYEMMEAGELGLRLQAIPILLPDGGLRPYQLPRYFRSDHLTVNMVKFFSDGGLSGRTAALKRPYLPDPARPARHTLPIAASGTRSAASPSPDYGVLRLDPDQYLHLARMAQEAGLGIATHAIGDAAIEMVIGIYKQLHHSFPEGLRRIEHLGLPEEQHLQDMARYDISTSMQAIFVNELGKNYRRHIDDQYLSHCFLSDLSCSMVSLLLSRPMRL